MAGNLLSLIFREAKQPIINMIEGVKFFATHEVEVGVTEESNAAHANGMTSAQLLYLHEKGSPAHNIPPRPVIGPAMAQDQVQSAFKSLMRRAAFDAIVRGNIDAAEAQMEKAGMIGRDACKKYITDGNNLAPNAPATIARKGSSTPLIDTGALLNSITYAVKRK